MFAHSKTFLSKYESNKYEFVYSSIKFMVFSKQVHEHIDKYLLISHFI